MILLDTFTGKIRPISLPEQVRRDTTGITGLAVRPGGYVAMLQPGRVAYLSQDFEVEHYEELPFLRDGHSITWHNGATYLVSTGTDQVLRLQDNGSVDVFWQASDAGRDTVHLNGLVWHNGECFVSGFGPKKSQLWRSADDGFIYNISKREYALQGVYHPHSPVFAADDLWVCESSRASVISRRGVRVETPWGYLRGLHCTDSALYVGSTFGRNRSKSTGVLIDNWADPGFRSGICGVGIIDLAAGAPKIGDFFDLSSYAEEIYAIIDPCGSVNSNSRLYSEREACAIEREAVPVMN
jgi:hypothetical protein